MCLQLEEWPCLSLPTRSQQWRVLLQPGLELCALPPGFSGATRFSGITVLGRGAVLGITSAVLAF